MFMVNLALIFFGFFQEIVRNSFGIQRDFFTLVGQEITVPDTYKRYKNI
jgi:hypothetical protein